MAKMRTKRAKLGELLNQIFDIADTDLVVFDCDTGLNDYEKNKKFADALDDLSKQLIVLSNTCTDRATKLRDKISDAEDQKHSLQDVIFVQEVIKDIEKAEVVHTREPIRYKSSRILNIKTEKRYVYLSDEQSDDEPEQWSGDPDTKFTFKKQNENDATKFHYPCDTCKEVFRDSHELRNHLSSHHKELFHCMKCSHLSRSQQSYQRHVKTHYSEHFQCKHCYQTFDLRSTLTNHLQKHSNEVLTCQKCGEKFGYRQSYLEHVKYRHRPSKSVPCPICKKMFWTPTNMQAHRAKRHGLVKSLLFLKPGETPVKSKNNSPPKPRPKKKTK